jgi:hypothetical protein
MRPRSSHIGTRSIPTTELIYRQSPLLSLLNPALERRFSNDIKTLHSRALKLMLWLSGALSLVLGVLNSDWLLVSLAVSLAMLPRLVSRSLLRVVGIGPAILIETCLISSHSAGELLGAFVFSSFFSEV